MCRQATSRLGCCTCKRIRSRLVCQTTLATAIFIGTYLVYVWRHIPTYMLRHSFEGAGTSMIMTSTGVRLLLEPPPGARDSRAVRLTSTYTHIHGMALLRSLIVVTLARKIQKHLISGYQKRCFKRVRPICHPLRHHLSEALDASCHALSASPGDAQFAPRICRPARPSRSATWAHGFAKRSPTGPTSGRPSYRKASAAGTGPDDFLKEAPHFAPFAPADVSDPLA